MAAKLNYHMHADLQQTKINQMLLYQQPYIKYSGTESCTQQGSANSTPLRKRLLAAAVPEHSASLGHRQLQGHV